MEVQQIHSIINSITTEVTGGSAVVNEDLSNIVDVGTSVFSATSVDNYVRSLVDRIGKVVFENRVYKGNAPSIMMDSWEYGSVLQKIQSDLPTAYENASWDLTDGSSYDPNIFYKPAVSAKFFNSKVTFEIPVSFTERQVKESFTSPTQLNAFLSMITNGVEKSMTIKTDSLIMRTINNMIAETVANEYTGDTPDYDSTSGIRAVNLLYLYNEKFDKTLSAEECLTDPDFIKFASYYIGIYQNRLSRISTLFNVGGKEKFTSPDNMKIILLNDFVAASNVYLESNTFHNEHVSLPKADVVPYWQGSGTDYGFESISTINVKTASEATVELSGIIGVIADKDSIGVANLNKRVTTNYNAKGEFFTNFYKFDSGYFNDLNENFVVFFVHNAS